MRNLKNEIIKENGIYTIKTETTFSDCVVGDGIILAMSKEREQLITYTSDFEIISVEPIRDVVSMQEYRFKKILFLVFSTEYGEKKLMMVSKGKAEWIKLWISKPRESCYKIDAIKGIYQVHPKKYIIITTECDSYHRSNLIYRDVVAEIDVDTKQTRKMFQLGGLRSRGESKSWQDYNYESSPRFIFEYKNGDWLKIYDLYTGFYYNMPDVYSISIASVYSSKEIIVLQNNQRYFLYINGYLVYQYSSEEHESVLYNLRNKKIKHSHKLKNYDTEYFFTVPIGENLCIWKKEEKPEIIELL